MEETITFHIDGSDKKQISETARNARMSVSTFCRLSVLEKLWQMADSGKLNLSDFEAEEARNG